LYFGGHQPRVYWNDKLVTTECKVTNHEVIQQVCTYQCRCRKECPDDDDDAKCHDVCETCRKDCYKAYYNTTYAIFGCPQIPIEDPKLDNCVGNDTSITFTKLLDTYDTKDGAYFQLKTNRPINSTSVCYYPYDETFKVLDSKYNDGGFFAASIVFFVFLGLSFVGLMIGVGMMLF
jgi:hypothetical protein